MGKSIHFVFFSLWLNNRWVYFVQSTNVNRFVERVLNDARIWKCNWINSNRTIQWSRNGIQANALFCDKLRSFQFYPVARKIELQISFGGSFLRWVCDIFNIAMWKSCAKGHWVQRVIIVNRIDCFEMSKPIWKAGSVWKSVLWLIYAGKQHSVACLTSIWINAKYVGMLNMAIIYCVEHRK